MKLVYFRNQKVNEKFYKKKQLGCLSRKVNDINVFVSFSFKGFLQSDSDCKTERQKKKNNNNKFNDFLLKAFRQAMFYQKNSSKIGEASYIFQNIVGLVKIY